MYAMLCVPACCVRPTNKPDCGMNPLPPALPCAVPPTGKIPVKEDLSARIGQIEERLAVRRDLAAQASWNAGTLLWIKVPCSTPVRLSTAHGAVLRFAALRLLLQTSMLAVFLPTCRKTRCWRSWSG